MPKRAVPLVSNLPYHIYATAKFDETIFRCHDDYRRMRDLFVYYNTEENRLSFSVAKKFSANPSSPATSSPLVQIIAWCIMPTHVHLVLTGLTQKGIQKFMTRALKSYAQYYNTKYKRLGQVWHDRFKNVAVESDEQLLRLTIYIHLNPVTAYLVNNPYDWEFSSYREYVDPKKCVIALCDYTGLLHMSGKEYAKIACEQIDAHRQAAMEKSRLKCPPHPDTRIISSPG